MLWLWSFDQLASSFAVAAPKSRAVTINHFCTNPSLCFERVICFSGRKPYVWACEMKTLNQQYRPDIASLTAENQRLRDWARDLEREIWRLHWESIERERSKPVILKQVPLLN